MGTDLRKKRIRRAFSKLPEKEFSKMASGRGIGKLPKKNAVASRGEFKPERTPTQAATAVSAPDTPRRIHPIEAKLQQDGVLILKSLMKRNGFLPLGDHSAPQAIYAEFSLSKRAFKQAIGHLWKQRKIDILPGEGIRLKHQINKSSRKGAKS